MSGILGNYYEAAAIIVYAIGFSLLLLHKNMIKKILGFNLMDTGLFLFLASKGFIFGRTAPILTDGIVDAEKYINPIPAGLVLTGIVVSVSVTAFMLALSVRLYLKFHTLNLDEISFLLVKEEK